MKNVPVGVTAGLFGAWLVHDAEEWFTMAAWSRENNDEIVRALPVSPAWRNGGISDVQAHSGIAAMGAVILAASAMGVKSRGRSGFFQTAFLAFGLHSLSHLGASTLFRGYTPGAITVPIVVLPYWAWGWRKLNRAGVLRNDPAFWATAAVAVPVTIGGVHLAAAGFLRARELMKGTDSRISAVRDTGQELSYQGRVRRQSSTEGTDCLA